MGAQPAGLRMSCGNTGDDGRPVPANGNERSSLLASARWRVGCSLGRVGCGFFARSISSIARRRLKRVAASAAPRWPFRCSDRWLRWAQPPSCAVLAAHLWLADRCGSSVDVTIEFRRLWAAARYRSLRTTDPLRVLSAPSRSSTLGRYAEIAATVPAAQILEVLYRGENGQEHRILYGGGSGAVCFPPAELEDVNADADAAWALDDPEQPTLLRASFDSHPGSDDQRREQEEGDGADALLSSLVLSAQGPRGLFYADTEQAIEPQFLVRWVERRTRRWGTNVRLHWSDGSQTVLPRSSDVPEKPEKPEKLGHWAWWLARWRFRAAAREIPSSITWRIYCSIRDDGRLRCRATET